MSKNKKLIVIFVAIIVAIAIVVSAICIHNTKIESSKLSTSVFELMLKKGYGETAEQWLISLCEETVLDENSAYEKATENAYSGTYEEWLDMYIDNSMLSTFNGEKQSAYNKAIECGYTGSEDSWKKCFKDAAKGTNKAKKSAYELCVENGFSEDRISWLDVINSSNGEIYAIAQKNGASKSQSKWIVGLMANSNDYCDSVEATYIIVKHCGYSDSISNWIKSLCGDLELKDNSVLFYSIAIENGYNDSYLNWKEQMSKESFADDIADSKDIDELYEKAVDKGYKGSKDSIIQKINGVDKFTPYEKAKEKGYEGSEEDFYKDVVDIINKDDDKNKKKNDVQIDENKQIDDVYVDEDNHIIVVIDDEEIDIGEIDDYTEDKKIYCVVFKDYDDSIIDVQLVVEGNNAKEPAHPQRAGYVFKGWDKSFEKINKDLEIKAQYQKSTAPIINVSYVEVSAGDKDVEVAISVENNPGFLGMKLSLEYNDSNLILKSVRNGDAVSSVLSLTKPRVLENGCNFCWDGVEIKDDQVKDGDILILTFDIPETAMPGNYPIKVSYKNGDIINNELSTISFDIINGSIKVGK